MGLEVQRYVGSCLISQAPLSLSRLALHAHGAPLILAGGGRRQGPRQPHHRPQPPPPPPPPAAEAAAEALNAASDESSGPSENSLPRIIKPRKRRKKDRKPAPPPARHQPAAPVPAPPSPEAAAPEGSSIVTLRPYVPLCFQLYGGARRPQQQPQQQQPRRRPEAACQCRSCDPRGHVWGACRRGREAAFASIPLFLGEQLPALRRSWSAGSASSSSSSDASAPPPLAAASPGLQVSTEIVTSPNGHRDLEIKFFSSSPPVTETASSAGTAATAWLAEGPDGDEGDADGDGECAEKLLGESLWANIVQAGADQ